MSYKKYKIRNINPITAACVHQLSDEEIAQQYILDIKHIGAMVDIRSLKKEVTQMVEKLLAYRAELEQAKQNALSKGIDMEAIEQEVAGYRDTLIKSAQGKLAEDIAKFDSDIDCINTLINREEATVVTPETEITAENAAIETIE